MYESIGELLKITSTNECRGDIIRSIPYWPCGAEVTILISHDKVPDLIIALANLAGVGNVEEGKLEKFVSTNFQKKLGNALSLNITRRIIVHFKEEQIAEPELSCAAA
jgi:hypothetical protein